MTEAGLPLAYRLLLRAYPRSFRERFGSEMAQLFLDRRREGANGVGLVIREAVDCARVAPRLHLESPMSRSVIISLVVALAVVGALAAGPVGLLPAALLAVVLLGLATERPVERSAGPRWWTWFAAAAACTGVLFLVFALDGDDLTAPGWVLAFVSGNAAIILVVLGLGHGTVRLVQHARGAAA